MPIYSFKCPWCNKVHDRQFPADNRPGSIMCECGGTSPYDFFETHREDRNTSADPWLTGGGYAGEGEGSVSRSLPKSMVGEFVKFDRGNGVASSVEYVLDKRKPHYVRPAFRSQSDQRRWDKAHNWRDGDSYY